jgi:hypothetical protein
MNGSEPHSSRSALETVALVLLWCVWQAIRLPLLALLTILAPVARIVLGGFAFIVTLMAFVLEFISSRPIPLFLMLGVGLGAYALLAIYEGLLQLLSGRRD